VEIRLLGRVGIDTFGESARRPCCLSTLALPRPTWPTRWNRFYASNWFDFLTLGESYDDQDWYQRLWRIGRNVLRSALQNFQDIEVVAINDLLEPNYLAYMLQYDSVHGRFKGEVSVEGNTLIVNGKKIRLTQEKTRLT